VSALLERLASGTPGNAAEAEPALSESVSLLRFSLAPSVILSFPLPRAAQGTYQKLQHLLGSQPASALQITATVTSAKRRGENC